MKILIIFAVGSFIAFLFLAVIFINYSKKTKAEKKAEKEKAKEQKETYKKEMAENEEIIQNTNTNNIVIKLHDLAEKGKRRQRN